jgi:hypothetical protein
MQIKQSTESCSRKDRQSKDYYSTQRRNISYKLICRNSLGFERQKNRAFEIRLKEYLNGKYIVKVNLTFARCLIYRTDMYSKTANTVENQYIEM